MSVKENTQAVRQNEENRATCSPIAKLANSACMIVLPDTGLWVVELQLRKCVAATNHVSMKAVKRTVRLRLDKLPQSFRTLSF
jgi:hypothetical protein